MPTIACTDSTAPSPQILSHTDVPAGPLLRRVDVVLDEPGPIRVAWHAGGDVLEIESEPALEHSLVLTRLRPATRYDYEIRAGDDVATGVFTTDSLPADIVALELEASGTPTEPLTLLEFARIDDSAVFSGVVIVDGGGNVVWYFRAERSITGTTRLGNGNFVFLDSSRGLLEVTPAGEVVAVLEQDAGRLLHHDVIAGPGEGVVLALRNDGRMVNDTLVAGEAIWEWDPRSGTASMLWSSFDALDPVADRGPRYSPGDWLHANSLHLGPRGNVLVSLHHLNQVISVAPDFGTLEWRLGGTNATLGLPAADRFSGQHTAAEIASDRVLVFDNGFERAEPWSRALEMDLAGGSVRNVWQFRPARDNWSRAVSAARRLPNGNTLVAFGMSTGLGGSTGPIEVYEAMEDGSVRWHLEVLGQAQIMFRATPIPSIGGEHPPL